LIFYHLTNTEILLPYIFLGMWLVELLWSGNNYSIFIDFVAGN